MFPINFNFPYRKKDGSLTTMEAAIAGGGTDLNITELDDVAIESLADGDILRYNGTTEKWENTDALTEAESDINDLDKDKMSWAANSILGVHNLADCDMATTSQAGFTATKGALSNGAVKYTVTGSDTGTTGTQFIIETDSKFFNTLKQYQGKRLKLRGCPAGGDTTNGYFLAIYLNYDGTVITANDTGDGAVIDVPSVLTTARIAITLRHETNTGEGLVFTPLVALNEDTSDDVTPYAMSNSELTELKKVNASYTGASSSLTDISLDVQRVGRVVQIGVLFTTSANVTAGTTLELTLTNCPLPSYSGMRIVGFSGTQIIIGWIDGDGKLKIRFFGQVDSGTGVVITGAYLTNN